MSFALHTDFWEEERALASEVMHDWMMAAESAD